MPSILRISPRRQGAPWGPLAGEIVQVTQPTLFEARYCAPAHSSRTCEVTAMLPSCFSYLSDQRETRRRYVEEALHYELMRWTDVMSPEKWGCLSDQEKEAEMIRAMDWMMDLAQLPLASGDAHFETLREAKQLALFTIDRIARNVEAYKR
jgi:hypothetical protein